ncbi:MAG: hypothetical protein GF317_05335 [Candidatus Lokiarchaeota archaeon]|nr:hypothetical protein [Candidatus Lokiarchaeota archaeon]MBD3199230.1 hypothetical protein [Candidatus Lokiarchaeota archaeon]
MKIGPLSLENNLFLAPLQNVSTAPFRRFCRHYSEIGLVFVPMIYVRRLVKNQRSIEKEFHKIEEESPIAIQLIGNEPDYFKKALIILESYNFDAIDINAGCSSVRSLKFKLGGYLLREQKLLKEILRTTVKYSSWPVSLKTRIGFNKILDIDKFSQMINHSGINFLTLHARKVKDNFEREKLDLDVLKLIKSKLDIPLIGNGDIDSPESAQFMVESIGVDGIMIGRACMGNPLIFNQISQFMKNREIIKIEKTLQKMKEYVEDFNLILNSYVEDLPLNYSKDKFKFTELKRNAIWFTRQIPNSKKYRIELSNTRNLSQLHNLLDSFFK